MEVRRRRKKGEREREDVGEEDLLLVDKSKIASKADRNGILEAAPIFAKGNKITRACVGA